MVFNGYFFDLPAGWHERLDGIVVCSRRCKAAAKRNIDVKLVPAQ